MEDNTKMHIFTNEGVLVTKQITIEAAHRLWDYKGVCKNVHGHSYRFEVTVEKELDPCSGMVLDFKILKEAMQNCIGSWDHSLILHIKDPFLSTMKNLGVRLTILDYMPTAENMAINIAERIENYLDRSREEHIEVVSVKVYETSTCYAEWRKRVKLCTN